MPLSGFTCRNCGMLGSNTCSAVTRTARALTASKGTVSVLGVRQDHALADEAHLRLGVGEFQLELALADELLARAAANRLARA